MGARTRRQKILRLFAQLRQRPREIQSILVEITKLSDSRPPMMVAHATTLIGVCEEVGKMMERMERLYRGEHSKPIAEPEFPSPSLPPSEG